jgi:hypothetical protein
MIHLSPYKLIIFNDLFGTYSKRLKREITLSKLQFPKETFDEITLCLRKIDPVLIGEPHPPVHSRLYQVIAIIYYKAVYLFISHEALDILLKERASIRRSLQTPKSIVACSSAALIRPLTPDEHFKSPRSSTSSPLPQETFYTPKTPETSPSTSSPVVDKVKTVKDCLFEDWFEPFRGDREALNFILDQFFPPLTHYQKELSMDEKNRFRLSFGSSYELNLDIDSSSIQIYVPQILSGILDPSTGEITFESSKMSVTGKYGWASMTLDLYRMRYDVDSRSFHMTTVKFFKESSGMAPLDHLKPFFNKPYVPTT